MQIKARDGDESYSTGSMNSTVEMIQGQKLEGLYNNGLYYIKAVDTVYPQHCY